MPATLLGHFLLHKPTNSPCFPNIVIFTTQTTLFFGQTLNRLFFYNNDKHLTFPLSRLYFVFIQGQCLSIFYPFLFRVMTAFTDILKFLPWGDSPPNNIGSVMHTILDSSHLSHVQLQPGQRHFTHSLLYSPYTVWHLFLFWGGSCFPLLRNKRSKSHIGINYLFRWVSQASRCWHYSAHYLPLPQSFMFCSPN